MAIITFPNSYLCIFAISILLSSIPHYQATGLTVDSSGDELSIKQNHIKKPMTEKITQFQLYWHDILSGGHPTSMNVTKPLTRTGFGQVNMIDNPLTLGPGLSSKAVGRAQGFYALTSQGNDPCLLMAMNFVLTIGKYNGSTITILGRNAVFKKVREMPVIGGSGIFRFARGYVRARTHKWNMTTGDATVKYNVYVMHY
ncbi:hypothetical protein OROGR_027933 [Orobanche gracilis]